MCSCCMCCCCANNSDSEENRNSWLSGVFKKDEQENGHINNVAGVDTAEEASNKIEQPKCLAVDVTEVEQSENKPSRPPTPTVIETQPSRRESFLSDSTFGDIPCIDVRLGLFDEDRFKDMSEAIFKKHS